LGFSLGGGGKVVALDYEFRSESGIYRLAIDGTEVVFKGLGFEKRNDKHPYVTLTVDLMTNEISSQITEAEDFD